MKKPKIGFVLLIVLGIVFYSCSKDNTSDYSLISNCTDTVSYSQDIVPILENNCNGCHNAGAGGYSFTDHTQTAANASAILNSMYGTTQLMPLGGPALPDSLIQKVQCWINQGKLNN
jgi:hypothetical protein